MIWDPFQAAAEAGAQARTLVNGTGLVANQQFYLAERGFTQTHPRVIDTVLAAIGEIDAWAKDNTDAVAAEPAPSVGIPAPILSVALKRQTYGVRALDATAIAEQQKIADAFHKLACSQSPFRFSMRFAGRERDTRGTGPRGRRPRGVSFRGSGVRILAPAIR